MLGDAQSSDDTGNTESRHPTNMRGRIGGMPTAPRNIIVMGVAGCGKSTVAAKLAQHLGYSFAEGDDFHSDANRAKQHAGIPLTDADREPWLIEIRNWIAEHNNKGLCTVVACSALKRRYRDILADNPGTTQFVHLAPPRQENMKRIRERSGHFMNPDLLENQYASLEELAPDESGFTVTDPGPPEAVLAAVHERLH